MFITKIAKRLMATVMTTALVLTGFVVAPKEVEAASGTPTVKILGATLRLDATTTSQALRVGIEISNASQAKNCGITLTRTSDNKSVTIETGENGANNIYDYNKDTDKLIYTVVLTGITPENFDESLKISGKVQSISDDEWTPVELDEEKSVNSVVEAMNAQLGTQFYFDESTLVQKVASFDFEDDLEKSFFKTYFNNPGWVSCSKIAATTDAHAGEQAIEVNSNAVWGGLPFPDLPSLGEYYLSCYVKKVADDDSDVTVRFRSALGKNCDESVTLTDEWQQLKSVYTLDDITTTDEYNNKHNRILVCPTEEAKNYLIDDVEIVKKVNQTDIPNMSVAKDFSLTLSKDNEATYGCTGDIIYNDNGTVSADLTGQYGGGGIGFFVKPDKTSIVASDYSKLRIKFSTNLEKAPVCISLRHNSSASWWEQPQSAIAYRESNSVVGEDTIVEIDLSGESIKDKLVYSVIIKNNGYAGEENESGIPSGFEINIKSIEFIA